MNGPTHRLIANIALSSLDQKERHILYPRWGGIESGATLSDDFRIMWEPKVASTKNKQLVHRCYVDSENSKNHGCVTRALDHAEGSISFIKDYMEDGESMGYTEDEFLENLGMFLGIASHHISDLCTPVHVGHKMDYLKAGAKSQSAFHKILERDLVRYSCQAQITLSKPQKISISKRYFFNIAKDTYSNQFVNLEEIYSKDDVEGKINMTSYVISHSIKHTANIWHTVLLESGMENRTWSMQPLL
ncbi:hypothetical protein GF406_16430 [candidate division KSB1 bacterium]|nr:hypothetical protein [candidate division KSB1 bacterium]